MEHSYILKIILKIHYFLIILLTLMIIYVSEIIYAYYFCVVEILYDGAWLYISQLILLAWNQLWWE